MFYFYSPIQTVFDSPRVSDTTSVSTTSTARVTLKTYTLSLPSGANMIRVIVYGYVSGYDAFGGRLYLSIDGTDVASILTITATEETLLIDYIGSITPGSRVIRIDGMAEPGRTLYVTRVYIATGIGLTTTTTTVNILSFTVTYQLLRSGDIRYSPGVRVFIWGNRKTTAPLSLTILEATNIIVGRNNLRAGNDSDRAETILAILTGSVTFQEGGEFTIPVTLRGAVGASGDVVIVTRVLARAQLRGESQHMGEVRVYERGVVEYLGRAVVVPVPGGSAFTQHTLAVRDIFDNRILWSPISGNGSEVTLMNWRTAVVTSIHIFAGWGEDIFGEGFLLFVQVVVWG
jgi:hypothetical protein